MLGTPVIVVVPRNSNYRMDSLEYRGVTVTDYVHPHVAVIASAVVDDFESAGRELAKLADARTTRPELPAWLARALDEYVQAVLPHDQPMLDAVRRLNIQLSFLQTSGSS
jgi:hypothetical protein